MADNIQEGQQQQNNEQQNQEAAALIAENMRQSVGLFGGKLPDNSGQQQPQEQQNGQQGGVAAEDGNKPPVFTFDPFKEKYGYQTPEDAYKEIEELRASREKYNEPTSIEDIAFDNPVSEKLYKAIIAGKTKEVYTILSQQDRLDSLTQLEINKDNAAEVIKFGMALKYPDLTQQEIDYKYNKQFSLPKEPIKRSEELDEDFEIRKQEWLEAVKDIETSKTIEAKLMRPELEAAKAKLSLPEVEAEIDEEYTKWKESEKSRSVSNEEIVNAYKSFTPESIAMKANFKDEANKVDFNFDYQPTKEQFSQALTFVENINNFLNTFTKSDGSPDREGFLQAMIFAVNRKEILNEALKQATNGTIKAKLPDNNEGGLVRHLPGNEGQKNEVDEMMKKSLAGWSR